MIGASSVGGDSHRFRRVGQHAVQLIGLCRILCQRPRLRFGNVVVGRADQPECRRRAFVQRVHVHRRAIRRHGLRRDRRQRPPPVDANRPC